MSRRIAAVIFILSLAAALLSGAAAAADGHWADAALDYAVRTGMLEVSDLRGEEEATRAELAGMVTRLLGLTAEAALDGFPDADPGHPQIEALRRAVALGLLQGSDGMLLPDDRVTREQAL